MVEKSHTLRIPHSALYWAAVRFALFFLSPLNGGHYPGTGGKTNKMKAKELVIYLAAAAVAAGGAVLADEGMWLFNAPPRALLREKYDFTPSDAWLEHLQKSSIRFNNGGSGSFVSEDGLIISNHHVGADALQKLSDERHNYHRDGFYARTRAEEKPCLDLELNVLISIEDVTAQVNAAVKPEMTPEQAFAARRAVMAAIEKVSLDQTGLRSDVITLYQGGQYHLYRYKKYTDVRLVFAPEHQIAFFGGDPDNFEYPRFNLDICLFRAYENGRPAKLEHYLKWSGKGVSERELVFVSGNPGSTDRQLTVDELEAQRDLLLPFRLDRLHDLEVMLAAYSARGEENARRARKMFLGVQNSRKATEGRQAGLLDPALMAKKRAEEAQLRQALSSQKEALAAWDEIRQAQRVLAPVHAPYALLESGQGFNSTLFSIARTLLRAAGEKSKPNGERLREFRESNRESLELRLFSEEPIYDDFEQVKLADSLTWLAQKMGFANPLVQKVLAGKSPRDRAAELVAGTKLKAVAARRQLYAADPSALQQAGDPMLELARLVDPEARRLRAIVETQDEAKQQAYAKIAHAKFAVEKGATYPDATFTLRLAFGEATGYVEDNRPVPFQTTFAGLFERAASHHDTPPLRPASALARTQSQARPGHPV